jgi:hypothetical protein
MGALKTVWETWKIVARKIVDFQARLILSLFYFLILSPFALVLRWRSDPLTMKARSSRGWQSVREPERAGMERAQKQY